MRHKQVLQPQNTKVSVIVEGKPDQLYAQRMRSFEQYNEVCKYFTEGKQRDNDAKDIQKHLQLYDLSLGEYLVSKSPKGTNVCANKICLHSPSFKLFWMISYLPLLTTTTTIPFWNIFHCYHHPIYNPCNKA